MDTQLRDNIAALLTETGQARHKAFEATDGADPDWPIWYAGFARDPFEQRFGMAFTKSQLVYCLMNADFEHQVRAPEVAWPQFYADEIVAHYSASESATEDHLALYYIDGCPYCNLVRSAIADLGIDVELRNVFTDEQHRSDLVNERGRATVPVLRITSPGGEDRWMPESRDIVRYLNKTYG